MSLAAIQSEGGAHSGDYRQHHHHDDDDDRRIAFLPDSQYYLPGNSELAKPTPVMIPHNNFVLSPEMLQSIAPSGEILLPHMNNNLWRIQPEEDPIGREPGNGPGTAHWAGSAGVGAQAPSQETTWSTPIVPLDEDSDVASSSSSSSSPSPPWQAPQQVVRPLAVKVARPVPTRPVPQRPELAVIEPPSPSKEIPHPADAAVVVPVPAIKMTLTTSLTAIPSRAAESFYELGYQSGIRADQMHVAVMEAQEWHRRWTFQEETGHTRPEDHHHHAGGGGGGGPEDNTTTGWMVLPHQRAPPPPRPTCLGPDPVQPPADRRPREKIEELEDDQVWMDREWGAKNPSPDDKDLQEPFERKRMRSSHHHDPKPMWPWRSVSSLSPDPGQHHIQDEDDDPSIDHPDREEEEELQENPATNTWQGLQRVPVEDLYPNRNQPLNPQVIYPLHPSVRRKMEHVQWPQGEDPSNHGVPSSSSSESPESLHRPTQSQVPSSALVVRPIALRVARPKALPPSDALAVAERMRCLPPEVLQLVHPRANSPPLSPLTLPSIGSSYRHSRGSSQDGPAMTTKSRRADSQNPSHLIEADDDEYDGVPNVITHPAPRGPIHTAIQSARDGILLALAKSGGDVSSPGFQSALEVLTKHFEGLHMDTASNASRASEGMWLTLTKPTFFSNLGDNDQGDPMYTLGRMSFDMFSPTTLVCSLQGNFNSVERVQDHRRLKLSAASAVPKSLRKEVEEGQKVLRTYNVVTAFTIEPPLAAFPTAPNKDVVRPIRGIMTTYGYTLADPESPNRHSVWITGGKIEPNDSAADQAEWKAQFERHPPKHGFGEQAKLLAVKLLMGATLPKAMAEDGSLEYTFTRPLGGHGMAYVDTVYVDETLRIVRGHRGTYFVFSRLPSLDRNHRAVSTPPL